MHRHRQRRGHKNFIFGPIFGNMSPVRLLFRQTYLWKTSNKAKKVVLTVNILGNHESVGRIFIYLFSLFFYQLFLTQMHILLALFTANINFIPIKKRKKLNLLIATANLSFLYIWCPITSSCWVLKMWKLIDGREWGWGWEVRSGYSKHA